MSNIHTIYLRLAPADIAYVKFLFEAYEEVGIVRTVDRVAAVIVILAVDDFLADARAILDDIQRVVPCEELTEPPADTDDWMMRELD